MGAQCLSPDVYAGQRLEQPSCLSEDGQTADQCFPVLEAATGALLCTDTQGRLEWQPAVPASAAGEAHARYVDGPAPAVHGARLSLTPDGIQRVDATLGACRTPRPRCAGQLPQPGRLQSATYFQNALFARIEVGHWLILSKSAQSIDRVGRGCEHLLAEGVVQQVPPFGPPWLSRGGPFHDGRQPTRPTHHPGSPGTISGFTLRLRAG